VGRARPGAGRPGRAGPPAPDSLRAWLKDPPAIRPGT